MSSKKNLSKKSRIKTTAAKATKKVVTNKRSAVAPAIAAEKVIKVVSEAADPRPSSSEKPRNHLPAVGTVIRKLDRYGNERCRCEIVDGGVEYKGKFFTSLSAAAMAAAKDLHLENKTQNGYTFWGLVKPGNRLEAATRAWERFRTHVKALVESPRDAERAPLTALLERTLADHNDLRGSLR